ncbi:MAG TPA: hypothetical protein VJL28_07400 [Gemmatimonadaceae bacterium]|nr:hypothetical protein [Gemmatimonadaceae bacterium]
MIAPAASAVAGLGSATPPLALAAIVTPEEIAVVAIVFGVFGMIGFPIARAFARRIEGARQAPAALPSDVAERLDRIERAVEAVALEVERISEGQRFVTKLLAERAEPGRLPGPAH